MDKGPATQGLNEALEANEAHEEAKATLRQWVAEHPEPQYADAYERIGDFVLDDLEHHAFKAESDRAHREYKEAKRTFDDMQGHFFIRFPAFVWLRVGNVGIGWGVKHDLSRFVSIKPWTDSMPILDLS